MKRLQLLTQVIGMVTLMLLAVYGALTLMGGARLANAAGRREAVAAGADIPSSLNYQAFLRDSGGIPVTGIHTITAKIYAGFTGGAPLYTTEVPDVVVVDGLFNIVLGDDPPLTDDVFADVPRYIGISLDGAAELEPRQRLHAVPWAMTAKTLVSGAAVSDLSVSNGLTVTGDLTLSGLPISYVDSPTPTLALDGRPPFIFRKYILGQDSWIWYKRDGVGADTGVNVNEYTCGLTGFNAGYGDIYENDSGWLLAAYTYENPDTGTWWIAAWLRTHNDHNDWRVRVMCVDNRLADVDPMYKEFGWGFMP
jgi:hypothetical protein